MILAKGGDVSVIPGGKLTHLTCQELLSMTLQQSGRLETRQAWRQSGVSHVQLLVHSISHICETRGGNFTVFFKVVLWSYPFVQSQVEDRFARAWSRSVCHTFAKELVVFFAWIGASKMMFDSWSVHGIARPAAGSDRLSAGWSGMW